MLSQKITNLCLYLAAFSVPLFFLPWTIEPLEINKQSLLTVLTAVACLCSLITAFVKGELTFKKTFPNFFLILFLIFTVISAVLSSSHFLSWVGASLQEYTSFFSLLLFVVFFFLISQAAKNSEFVFRIILVLSFGAIVTGFFGLLSIFGLHLPFSFAQTSTFNTIGTINALGIFLSVNTISLNAFFLISKKRDWLITLLNILLSLFTLVTLILINYWVIWLIFLFGLSGLLIIVFLNFHRSFSRQRYLFSMILVVVSVVFLVLPALRIVSLPIEVVPNLKTSLSITKQTLNNAFWFGSGPGTYLFDYTQFRPTEVNQTNFWNTRFDRSFSEILTTLTTKGFLATLSITLFAASISFLAIKKLLTNQEESWLAFVFFPAWSALAFSFIIYSANFTLAFLFFLMAGTIYSLNNQKTKIIFLTQTPKRKIFSLIGFVATALIFTAVLFLTVQRFGAELAFAQAIKLDRSSGDLGEVAKLIDRAASLNRFNDTYYRNLAEVLLLKVETEIKNFSAKQPTEEENKYLQALIAASINAAKTATNIEPRNVTNWLELASVYRAFNSLIPGADVFAVNANKEAINLEPKNPSNYLELGKTYLALAAAMEPLIVSEDQTTKQTAEQKRQEYFTAAEDQFNMAISLKSDYAPAHYQLALTFERQEKLNEAIGKMESINKFNPQDVGVAFELGLLYLRRLENNDLILAEQTLKQAISLLPSYSNAHWYLAFVYEQQGNLPAAIYEIEAVKKLNPDNQMIKARLERLRAGQITTANETTPLEDSDP